VPDLALKLNRPRRSGRTPVRSCWFEERRLRWHRRPAPSRKCSRTHGVAGFLPIDEHIGRTVGHAVNANRIRTGIVRARLHGDKGQGAANVSAADYTEVDGKIADLLSRQVMGLRGVFGFEERRPRANRHQFTRGTDLENDIDTNGGSHRDQNAVRVTFLNPRPRRSRCRVPEATTRRCSSQCRWTQLETAFQFPYSRLRWRRSGRLRRWDL